MFFAGLTSAYVVSVSGRLLGGYQAAERVLREHQAILVSSVSMQLALMAARRALISSCSIIGRYTAPWWGLHVEPVPRLEGIDLEERSSR
ncbi:MAG: hypothetical protein IPN62_16740 [Flavobacteriales bacterium]|nr:hypothetical protein [Flavobacteriales bacterium]